jgi:short-subunit dehydrogenase
MAGSRVLVTGATSGIGQATVDRLLARDVEVWATARSPEDLEALKARGARPVYLDLREDEAIADLAAELGPGEPLDGLVHNAGIGIPGAVEDLDRPALSAQLDVNVVGPIELTRRLAPGLRAAEGAIVLVSSLAALTHVPCYGGYCASKSALEALGDTLRLEMGPAGVDVCMVQPGPVATAFQDRSRRLLEAYVDVAASEYREAYERIDEAIIGSLPRVDVDDVAQAIERGLTAERPPTRIPVGRWAGLGAKLLGWLPDRVHDRVLRWLFPT